MRPAGRRWPIRVLVDGLSPPGPTTHSPANRDFPARCTLPRFRGDLRKRLVSGEESLVLRSLSGGFVSARKIPFPGNGEWVRAEILVRNLELISRKAQHLAPEETKTKTYIDFLIPEDRQHRFSTYLKCVRPRMLQLS